TRMTAVFVPDAAIVTDQWDVILWLHGHKTPKLQIDDYLAKKQFKFREMLNIAKKQQILIAPTIGPNSGPGMLAKDGDKYLDQVLQEFADQKLGGVKPTIDTLTLACHSGGGVPMLA